MRSSKRTTHWGFWLVPLLALLVSCGFAQAAEVSTNLVVVSSPSRLFEWKPFLGPFHALVLHYPIGFLTLAVILEGYRHFKPASEIRDVIRLIVWLSLVTGLMAAILGLLRATNGDYESHALGIHRIFGMLVPAVTVGTLYLQKFAYRPGASAAMQWVYRGVLGITFGLLAVAGHYGGNLTHGSRYLYQNAPEFMRSWLDESPEKPPDSAATGATPGERLYVESVHGIFANKCVSCHGSEKLKGKYRLDVPEIALAGGSSGQVAIKPGDPFASELVRRVMLPATHDEVMPPDGKQPLTGAELQAVVNWIQLGAPFPKAGLPGTGRPGPWQGSNATQRPQP